jgi:hypothetical protein
MEETAIHAVDKSIANTLGESLITRKRAHRAHHVLVICIHRNTNMVAIPVDIVQGELDLHELDILLAACCYSSINNGE